MFASGPSKRLELLRVSGRPANHVAEELGISVQTLRNWDRNEKAARGEEAESLRVDEKKELADLCKEVRRLKMEKEILRKAAAFFAREEDPR